MPKSITRHISCIYRYGHSALVKNLATTDISRGHLPYLLTIMRNQGISQDRLSSLLQMDKTTTARAVKSLVELKYLTRKRDPNDKRVYQLFSTPKMEELIPKLESAATFWDKVITKGLTKPQKQQALQLLEHMANNATQFKKKTNNSF